jgi:predicted nucleic acid-binding protein
MEDIARLINQYRNKGVLVDTNILVLLFVGATNRDRIEKFKRTQQFIPEDYDLLVQLLKSFSVIVVTPNVLTEVNSLLNQLGEPERGRCLAIFGQAIAELNERYVISREVVLREEFGRFGLTDIGIAAAAQDKYLVLTDDLRFAVQLQAMGIDTVNFNNLRILGWA